MNDRPHVLVTGGNSGIGLECSRALARAGRNVLIAARNRAASDAAVAAIERESGPGRATAMTFDLADLGSVRAFVREIEARDVVLSDLVCNAGVQVFGKLKRSIDGHELSFAVNHLGHFLLTELLLPRLRATAPSRIVVVASGVHDPKRTTGMPKPDVGSLDVLASTGGPRAGAFDGRLAYVNSKLCNLWFAYELDRRLRQAPAASRQPVTVNGFDPGLVPGSGLGRDYPPALRFVWDRVLPGVARVLSPVLPTINLAPKSGGALARLVTDPALATATGQYFPSHSRWQAAKSSDLSYDERRAGELWSFSARLAGLDQVEGVAAI